MLEIKPTEKRVYTTVAEVFSDPSRFTVGAAARDANNRPVPIHDPSAVKWCFAGAVELVYGAVNNEQTDRVVLAVKELWGVELPFKIEKNGYAIGKLNDAKGYEGMKLLADVAKV